MKYTRFLYAALLGSALIFNVTACSFSSSSLAGTETSTTATSASDTSEAVSESASDTLTADADGTVTFSDSRAAVSGSGITAEGTAVTITAAGVYVLSGSCSDGQINVDTTSDSDVTLIFNSIALTCATCPLIVTQANNVTVSLAADTENSLTDGSSYTLTVDNSNVDGVLFSKDDLTIEGSGTLTVNANYSHGIVCKDTLIINSGTLNITATEDCIQANDLITINGGAMNLSAGDDGIHCDSTLQIENGTINITQSEEGLEGSIININGGNISIVSNDDGINAAGDEIPEGGYQLNINGGYLLVNARGDGVDSNGTLTVTGGTTLVSGPTNDGNGAVDYETSASISGGIFIAAGSSQMAESFTDTTAQCAIMTTVDSQSGGTSIALCDSDGNVLASFTPAKDFNCIIFSTPAIVSDGSYTIVASASLTDPDSNGFAAAGTSESSTSLADITMNGTSYSTGGMGMGGMGGMDGGPGGSMNGGGNMSPPGSNGSDDTNGGRGNTPSGSAPNGTAQDSSSSSGI